MKKAIPAAFLSVLLATAPVSGKVIQEWYTADCGVIERVQEKIFIVRGKPAHPVTTARAETGTEVKDRNPTGRPEKKKGKGYLRKVLWITACALSRLVF